MKYKDQVYDVKGQVSLFSINRIIKKIFSSVIQFSLPIFVQGCPSLKRNDFLHWSIISSSALGMNMMDFAYSMAFLINLDLMDG